MALPVIGIDTSITGVAWRHDPRAVLDRWRIAPLRLDDDARDRERQVGVSCFNRAVQPVGQ